MKFGTNVELMMMSNGEANGFNFVSRFHFQVIPLFKM